MAFLIPVLLTVGSVAYAAGKTIKLNTGEEVVESEGNFNSFYSDPSDLIMDPNTIVYDNLLPVVDRDSGAWGIPRSYYNDPSGLVAIIQTWGKAGVNNLTKS